MRRATIILAGLCLALGEPGGQASAQLFSETSAVSMTAAGAAGINAATLFRAESLAAAMPGMRITRSSAPVEGGMRPVFLVSQRGEVLLRVYGGEDGRVSMVEGLSRKIYGPGRTRVGMRFSQVDGGRIAYCEPGAGPLAGALFCGAEPGATLWFVFQKVGDAAAIAGPGATPETMAEAELIQIRWTAEPGIEG